MAFIDPLKPIIARMFATDVPPKRRIEIGPGSNPTVNEIRFYSGQATETNYGYIDVQGTATSTTMDMAPPRLAGTPAIPLFFMKARTTAPESEIYHEAVQHDLFVTGALGNFPMLRVAANGPNGDVRLNLSDGANDEVWHAAAFNGTWTDFGAAGTSDTRFRKLADGTVIVTGTFKDTGAQANPVFTLDVGYRPGQTIEIACKSNNDAGTISWMQINSAGQVNVVGNVAQARIRCGIPSVTFFAEN